MKTRLSLDRFEGRDREIAVLYADGKREILLPRDLLPRAAEAGDILTLRIDRDLEATRAVHEHTRATQAELKKRDPGGDITL